MQHPSRRGPVVAALLVLAVLAAACSSSDSTSSDATATSPPGSDGTSATTSPNVLLPADGPPQTGGELVYALGSESDGFDPTASSWATDGTLEAMALYDPLAAYDAEGRWAPYLAKSFEPNEDFTVWTITLRPDITFHDGTSLDAEAVKLVLDAHRQSPLTGKSVALIENVEVADPLTVVVTMSEPWASFPVAMTGQAGVIPAPSQFADPDGSRNPVGTGPFRFVSWVPDKELVVERNPDYWQVDADGQQLPYLDRIVFRPLADDSARLAAIESGEVDMTHTVDIPTIDRLRTLAADGDLQLVEQQEIGEVTFVILNLAAPPFDDPLARQALAYATDAQAWVDVMAEGETTPADSVFRPTTEWYAPDAGYPEHDVDRARELAAEYEQAHGAPLSFTLGVIGSPGGTRGGQFLQSMWQEAGIDVDIDQSDAATYIVDAVTGNYQAKVWGQFGSPDPDYEHVWWLTSSSAPVGQLSLNFPRNEDPDLDAALRMARSTDDLDVRREAYVTVQERLAEDLPYIYLDYPVPVKVARNQVRGILQERLPDGGESIPLGGPGSFSLVGRLTQTWVTD